MVNIRDTKQRGKRESDWEKGDTEESEGDQDRKWEGGEKEREGAGVKRGASIRLQRSRLAALALVH